MRGRVLIVAGSDSGGGAGIQADIKTVSALGGYAMTAITALTAQNSLGVHAVELVDPDFVARQIAVTADDLGVDAVKTGMLATAPIIAATVQALQRHAAGVPVVVDPVMRAKGGASLLDAAAVAALRERLLPLATVLTPNLPEAEALTGQSIASEADALEAGHRLRGMGAAAVLIKGGHGAGAVVTDWLVTPGGVRRFDNPRVDSRHTHGTGCTLASAIACGLAQQMPLADAVARAIAYVQAAIRSAPGFGAGHGPLDHGVADPAPPAW